MRQSKKQPTQPSEETSGNALIQAIAGHKISVYAKALELGVADAMEQYQTTCRLGTHASIKEARQALCVSLAGAFQALDMQMLLDYLGETALDGMPKTHVHAIAPLATPSLASRITQLEQAPVPVVKPLTKEALSEQWPTLRGVSLAHYTSQDPVLCNSIRFFNNEFDRMSIKGREEMLGAIKARFKKLGAKDYEVQVCGEKILDSAQGRNSISTSK